MRVIYSMGNVPILTLVVGSVLPRGFIEFMESARVTECTTVLETTPTKTFWFLPYPEDTPILKHVHLLSCVKKVMHKNHKPDYIDKFKRAARSLKMTVFVRLLIWVFIFF